MTAYTTKLIALLVSDSVWFVSRTRMFVSLEIVRATNMSLYTANGQVSKKNSMLIVSSNFVSCLSWSFLCCWTSLVVGATMLLFRNDKIMMMLPTKTIGIGMKSKRRKVTIKYIGFHLDWDIWDLYSLPILVCIVLFFNGVKWNIKTSTMIGRLAEIITPNTTPIMALIRIGRHMIL